MRRLWIVSIASALVLAACGGDSLTEQTGTGTGSTTTPTVTGVSVTTSAVQVASDGTGPATITAYLHDANNNTVPSANVAFSSSSGLLTVTQGTTDATGAATATLTAGSDPSNRNITVTATSGSSSGTVTVAVTGTTLSVTGPQSLVEPGSATYTVILKNSAGTGLLNQSVSLTSANGNTLSAATVMTDDNGQATVTVTAANGGADTLTATALGLTATESISVSTQNFAFTAPAANTNINLGASQAVTVTWTNSGAPVAGQTVNFAATRGTLSAASAVTNASGVATVNISSTTSGPAVVTATGAAVSTQVGMNFLATTPAHVDVQPSPSTINVNAQSTITAVVRDAANNLVANKLVDFALQDITGGTLSVASALTNSQGVAQTIYTASGTTSATNGVSITATVEGTTVASTAELTVAGETVFLSLGTGNTIDILNEAQYGVQYAVQALDGAGNAVPNVSVTLKATSVSYYKGQLIYSIADSQWIYDGQPTLCASEDLNNNGILDPGEDFNNNGKLDPGTVASATPGTVVTSATATTSLPAGSALFSVVYPKDHSKWVTITLTATATVAGTQSSTSTTFLLVGLASDYAQQNVEPPGQYSPYGVATNCANPN